MTDSKNRLLIIDDEQDLCEILKSRFEKRGFEVKITHEGVSGLEAARRFCPQCILLDSIIHVGEDSLTFLRKLRSYRDEDSAVEAQIRSGLRDVHQPIFAGHGQAPQDGAVYRAEGVCGQRHPQRDREDRYQRERRGLDQHAKREP